MGEGKSTVGDRVRRVGTCKPVKSRCVPIVGGGGAMKSAGQTTVGRCQMMIGGGAAMVGVCKTMVGTCKLTVGRGQPMVGRCKTIRKSGVCVKTGFYQSVVIADGQKETTRGFGHGFHGFQPKTDTVTGRRGGGKWNNEGAKTRRQHSR